MLYGFTRKQFSTVPDMTASQQFVRQYPKAHRPSDSLSLSQHMITLWFLSKAEAVVFHRLSALRCPVVPLNSVAQRKAVKKYINSVCVCTGICFFVYQLGFWCVHVCVGAPTLLFIITTAVSNKTSYCTSCLIK